MTTIRSMSAGALILGCLQMPCQTADAAGLLPYAGLQPPAFMLEAPNGNRHALEDYAGKVVLVNFWTTWCPPCVNELPAMQRLLERMRAKPFEILAINVGESSFKVDRFLKLTRTGLTTLLDPKGNVFEAWGGTAYPLSFLVDTTGRVRYVAMGPLDWDGHAIDEILKELLDIADTGVE